MQIRIVQVEIEEAIRNHILSQISLKPDQNIEIELSATRGPEGFIATIDISAANTARPAAAVTPTIELPAAKPAPEAAKAPAAIRKAAPPIEAKMDEPEAAPAPEKAAEPAAQPAQNEEPALTAAPTNTGRSLFGGLTPPKNS